MKSIFSSRKNKQPHKNEEQDRKRSSFFSKKSKSPFFSPSKTVVQTKLTIGTPGDKYEKEADSMADAVVSNSASKPDIQHKEISSIQRESLATPLEDEKLGTAEKRMEEDKLIQEKPELQQQESEEEEGMISKMEGDEEESEAANVQTKTNNSGTQTAQPGLSSKIKNTAGKGRKLPAKTRMEMESSFGRDFSDVNVHTDQDSVEMNKDLKAQAFTHGKDIYFGPGKFNPESSDGKRLLAHELTHTIQQGTDIPGSGPTVQRTIGDGFDLSAPRFKGIPELEAAFDDERIVRFGNRGEHVSIIQQALLDAGFELPDFGVDGIFGSETKAAVMEFQRQSGLEFSEVDGEIGSTTMSRLDSRFTGDSANKVQHTCEVGIKTITIDVVMMSGATGNPAADIALANSIFAPCCIQFRLGKKEPMPAILSDILLDGDTDFLFGECGEVSAEDLVTVLTAKRLFNMNTPITAFYAVSIHDTSGDRFQGISTSPLCGTGPRAPLIGTIAKANGSDNRTFPHEIAHVLMNTFADHSVTRDNLQNVDRGTTGTNISPVQCAIMYSRA